MSDKEYIRWRHKFVNSQGWTSAPMRVAAYHACGAMRGVMQQEIDEVTHKYDIIKAANLFQSNAISKLKDEIEHLQLASVSLRLENEELRVQSNKLKLNIKRLLT